jgi:hypothetical protein
MVRKVTYVNKITREISPTLNYWIENLKGGPKKSSFFYSYYKIKLFIEYDGYTIFRRT